MSKQRKNKKRDKKYITNKEQAQKSSKMNTWILIGITIIGAGLVVYLS